MIRMCMYLQRIKKGADEMKQLQRLAERAITVNASVIDKMWWQPPRQAQKTEPQITVLEKT